MDRKWNVTVNRVNTVNGETYPTTHQSVPAELIDFEERSQKLMAAEAAYFDRFGTACE